MSETNGQVATQDAEVIIKDMGGGLMTEVGRSGLKVYGGYVQEEFLRELQGDRARKTYREMADNDPIVGAILFAIDMLIRQVDWHWEPSEQDTTGEVADFAQTCIEDMSQSWADTLSSVLSFLPFGWSYFEVIYKLRQGQVVGQEDDPDAPASSRYDDGRIGWRKLAIRGQDSLWKWEFDPGGGIRGMWQLVPPSYAPAFIPIEKSLLFRTSTQKNNPEGRSVLRNAYRPWFYKRRIEEIEAIGIERDLAGLPVMHAPARLFDSQASAPDKLILSSLEQMVRNIRRNEQEGIVMPDEYDQENNPMYRLELLTTGGRRQFDTDAVVARYDQRISMVTLGDFILLGHEKIGSRALGVSKVELFATALTTWLDSIAGVFNQYGMPRLLRMNGIPDELTPTLVHSQVERTDLDALGNYMLHMAQAGNPLFPDIPLENYLREQAGLPLKETTPDTVA